jgi:hypothetical protein
MSECIEHNDCDFGCGACNWHAAVQFERNRIIELLEENSQGSYKRVVVTPRLIGLIKGETNAGITS